MQRLRLLKQDESKDLYDKRNAWAKGSSKSCLEDSWRIMET